MRALRNDARVGADIVAIMTRDPAALSFLHTVSAYKGAHTRAAKTLFFIVHSCSNARRALRLSASRGRAPFSRQLGERQRN